MNQQSYNLDVSFHNALKDIEYLKNIVENQSSQNNEVTDIKKYQEKVQYYEQKVIKLEEQIEKIAFGINQERKNYENLLRGCHDDVKSLH